MGYVEARFADMGTPLTLIVRDKPLPAVVAPMPFVPHTYKRLGDGTCQTCASRRIMNEFWSMAIPRLSA